MKTDVSVTKRQQEVLDTISRLTAECGLRPTFREVMVPLGIKSPNGIVCHLKSLKRQGLGSWEPKLARTLRVVPQPESRGIPLVTLEQISN